MSMIVFAVLAIVVALAVWGMVAMGMAGKGKTRHPRLANRFARYAQALNGESEPPERFVKLLR